MKNQLNFYFAVFLDLKEKSNHKPQKQAFGWRLGLDPLCKHSLLFTLGLNSPCSAAVQEMKELFHNSDT